METEKNARKPGFRLTIGNKIIGSFTMLILLFIIVGSIIFGHGNRIDQAVLGSRDNYRPSKDAINEFILLATRSRMLVTNWVYLQTNEEDKRALRELQESDYPELRKRLAALSGNWQKEQQQAMDSILHDFDSLLILQRQEIMANLQGFDNYEDPMVKFMAETALENTIIPLTNDITRALARVAEEHATVTIQSDEEVITSIQNLKTQTVILAGIFLGLAILSAIYLVISITRPVNFLKNIVISLGKGELVADERAAFSNDQIGDMAVAMDNLVAGLKRTTIFAENIGKGQYQTDFQPLSGHDVLGNALINMRDNLARVAEDDKKRHWATEGLARFGEILRSRNDDIVKLADEIVGGMVKYLHANQGALYIIDQEREGEEETMSMRACYAWEKKKFINHKIHKGEGLAGQAWQEGDIIFLTEVPKDYIRITSGLGDATPTSVLIVPLKVNDETFGVMEMASFHVFRDFEIEFVRRMAESIASTISSVRNNSRTQQLLEESQEMTEQMRAQEEELRQNMEELQATQEEMERGQSEAQGVLKAINDTMAVVEFDTTGVILKANHNFLQMMGYKSDELMGESHRMLLSKSDRNDDRFRNFWKDLAAGHAHAGEFMRINKKGEAVWLLASYSPIRNQAGMVVRIMCVGHDITALKATETAAV